IHSLTMAVLHILSLLCLLQLGAAEVSDEVWAQFKAAYNKEYTSAHADSVHRRDFERKFEVITKHNQLFTQGWSSYWMGFNEFTDINLSAPYLSRMAGAEPPEAASVGIPKGPGYVSYDMMWSEGVDWRQYDIVSEVRNQGVQCLSCWAFSSSSALESHIARKYGNQWRLSPQNLIDCVPAPSMGCWGGWVSLAFKYISTHTLASEDAYPYSGRQGSCQPSSLAYISGYLQNYVTLNSTDERELAEVVYNIGPVVVSIDHLHDGFENYGGGVLSIPNCGKSRLELKHSVLVVGFGTDPALGEYWLIKNSFGVTWGEEGYFRLARNAGNMCGVASLPQFPLV
ncbi:hypothetical protein KR018_001888, partial [Drosophila ironensis]